MNSAPLPKILLVDDKPENLFALEQLLQGVEATLVSAGQGEEALRLCLEHEIALLLLDIDMPGMDGFQVATLLKGVAQTAGIPIIFLTAAFKDEAHRLEGYEKGAARGGDTCPGWPGALCKAFGQFGRSGLPGYKKRNLDHCP